MPKAKTITTTGITEAFTISRYEVMAPPGESRATMSTSIDVQRKLTDNASGNVLKVETRGVSVNGLMPDGVTGKVQDLLLNYVSPRIQGYLDAGVPLPDAYDAGTAEGMYVWIQANRPDVIPPDAQ